MRQCDIIVLPWTLRCDAKAAQASLAAAPGSIATDPAKIQWHGSSGMGPAALGAQVGLMMPQDKAPK